MGFVISRARAQDSAQSGGGIAAAGHASLLPPQIAPARRTQAAALRMKLPFPEGTRYEVYQGNSGTFTHRGFNSYAWDFGLPEGRPVCAVAQGRVVRVKQDSDSGGTTQADYAKGNVVILDHGNGLFTQYLHLKKDSLQVREGEMVEPGQVIALSGNTGFSTTPHLHFQLQDASGQSLPGGFLDVRGDGVPRSGCFYTSGNDGKACSRYAGESLLPPDVFAQNKVVLTHSSLPAHLLHADRNYQLEGKVLGKVRKVVIYVMGAQGGHALLSFVADVASDGSFSSQINLGALRQKVDAWSERAEQSNLFALAIAPLEEDGSYWSDFSVPVSVR